VIRRRTLGIGAALAFLGSAALLVSGHPLLNWPENGLPIGTLLAGVMVASLGAMPLALARPGGWAARIAKAAFALAIAWLPLSLLLAGNLRLNFEGGWRSDAATWLGMAVLLALFIAGAAALASQVAALRRR
jgi:hypothetical protein